MFQPRLKDALAPTSAFAAVPSSLLPDLNQSHVGNAEPVAGEKQYLKTAGQPRVSSSDTIIKQRISFSSQNGDSSHGHSPSHGPRVEEVSVEVSQTQPGGKLRSSNVNQSVEISGKSQPKMKVPLLPYSSTNRQDSGSPRLKSSSPRHRHSSGLYEEVAALESRRQKASPLDYSNGNGYSLEEDSVYEPGYATVGRPQMSSTPVPSSKSPRQGRVKPEHYLMAEYKEIDIDDFESAVEECHKGGSKKKVPVYSKVVKRLSQSKSEKRKSSTELPSKSSTLKQERQKNKFSKEQKKEAVVRFADKEEKQRREVYHFDEKEDFQGVDVESHVERHKRSVKKDTTSYSSDGNQHETDHSYKERNRESSIRTKLSSPSVPYPSHRNVSKMMLPMGYRGDHDELDSHEEYEDSAEEELKPLSLNFSDAEDQEDQQGFNPNATFPLTAKEKERTTFMFDPLPPYGTSRASVNKSKDEISGKMENARPSSVPPTLNGVPVIRPSSVKKATSTISNDVYIFSERQPDGKLQYFAASPVHISHHTPDGTASLETPVALQTSSPPLPLEPSQPVYSPSELKPLRTIKKEENEYGNEVGEANARKRHSIHTYSTPEVMPTVALSKAGASQRFSLPERNSQLMNSNMIPTVNKEEESTQSKAGQSQRFSQPSPNRPLRNSMISTVKKEELTQSKAVPSHRFSLPSRNSPLINSTTIPTIKKEEKSTQQAVSHEVVSSHSLSSISLDDQERTRSKSLGPSEYTSTDECSGEMEANKRTIQELVDVLATERKTVEAEKHNSKLMEVCKWARDKF